MLQIQRVGVAVPGGALTVGTPERLTFSRPGFAQVVATGGCTVIDGHTVDTVYPQLVATVSAQTGSVEHVLCRIEHSPEIDDIAPLYPALQPATGRPELGEGPTVPEFNPRTMWSLENAFTSAFKDLEPIPQFKATAKLGAFLMKLQNN
jgi:hypothetical protein